MAAEHPLPFRLLLISNGAGDFLRLLRAVESGPMTGVAVMLRDTESSPDVIQEVIGHALSRPIRQGVTPIVAMHDREVSVPSDWWTHLPARVAATPGPIPTGAFGVAAHDEQELSRAADLGARYATFGPVFPTPSKPGHPGVGTEVLAAVCRRFRLPIIAQGGMVDGDRIDRAIAAGAAGVASIRLGTESYADRLKRLVAQEETPS